MLVRYGLIPKLMESEFDAKSLKDFDDKNKVYNFVSEVHPSEGFKSVTGERKVVASRAISNDSVDSALTRYSRNTNNIDQDVPW